MMMMIREKGGKKSQCKRGDYSRKEIMTLTIVLNSSTKGHDNSRAVMFQGNAPSFHLPLP